MHSACVCVGAAVAPATKSKPTNTPPSARDDMVGSGALNIAFAICATDSEASWETGSRHGTRCSEAQSDRTRSARRHPVAEWLPRDRVGMEPGSRIGS